MAAKMNGSNYIDINFDLSVTNVELALEKKCPLNWKYKCTSRDNHGFVYILSETAKFIFDDRVEWACENDILYLRKGDSYCIEALPDTSFEFIVISFDIDSSSEIPFETVNRFSHAKRFYDMFKAIEEINFAKRAGYRLCCRSLTEQLIYHIFTEYFNISKISPNIKATIDYMENYYNKTISVDTLASIAGVSQPHYRRTFKEAYGISPTEYIGRLRIGKAKDMIKSELYSQSEIAALCGFENVYYFSKVFKKYAGVPPGAY